STESLKESAVDKKDIYISLQNTDFKSVDSALSVIDGITSVTRLDESAKQLDVRLNCQSAADPRAAIYEAIKQTNWVLLDFHQETQTLEIIFRELTRESA
ncbi:MAG: hypothetical protein PVG74_22655, partial [Desulfobacterales bacterium]